jgi:hypothetical protein
MQNGKESTKFYVMQEPCAECLFTSKRVVDKKRYQQIVEECRASGHHFICHKASLAGDKNVCCRQFYNVVGTDVFVIRLAHMLNLVEFVAEEDLADLPDRVETSAEEENDDLSVQEFFGL